LACGGDIAWITEGVSAAPPILQKICRLSGDLAYNLKGFMLGNCFSESDSGNDREYMFEALIVLAYYQSLACLSLATGLVCESVDNEKYLPKSTLSHSSYESFEMVRLCENLQAESEK
jgi:hypothetical protein